MISVEKLSKRYGKQVLFDSIGFKVNAREKIGVVGRNGHGKTTLFRMIIGEDQVDSGKILVPRHYRIGYLEQAISFSEQSVLNEAARGLPPSDDDQLWRVEKVLSGLGFSASDLNRPPSYFSAGYQVRINLAKVLLSDADMLLLDEPNNFLDITSIRWLVGFLREWQGELMMITHDRNFMDRVVSHTLGIHRRKVRKIPGDTQKYYSRIAQDEETYEKTRINDDRKRKEVEVFINRFRAKARLAGLVQSRIKNLARMEKREKLEKISSLDFNFNCKPFHGKYALEARDLGFSFKDSNRLIDNLSLSVRSRDRVMVIGKNGKGKTTLLKLLAGELNPLNGDIISPLAVRPAYYEQSNIRELSDHNTVLEEITGALPDMDPKRARSICGLMMFEGDDALKRISVLSGGEKSRVLLGKILATPVNLLLLDEPTNHLDLESCDALLAALDNFEGAVIMVTHNELYLHALSERLIVFQGGATEVHEGDYQSFLEKIGWLEEKSESEKNRMKSHGSRGKSKKEQRRIRSEFYTERAKVLKPIEDHIKRIEAEIETCEESRNRMNREIIRATEEKNSPVIIELSKEIHRTSVLMDRLLEELEGYLEEQEEQTAIFARQEQKLDL